METTAHHETEVRARQLTHRGKDWWALQCDQREPFNTLMRNQRGKQWSATWKAWLLPLDVYAWKEVELLLQKEGYKPLLLVLTNEWPNGKLPEKIMGKANALPPNPPLKPNLPSAQNQQNLEIYKRQLVLKGYSPATCKTYSAEFIHFLKMIKGVPAQDFTPERIKDYLYYCHTTLKLTEATLHSKINALKFYYEQVLHREAFFWEIPRPKRPIQLPSLFNQDEIAAIIKGTENPKHKVMLMVAYSSGLRVSEVVALKPTHIDSKRMCLTIEQGKGKKDRMVSLSPVLLVMLRAYWQQWKPTPKVYLFEGTEPGTPYTVRSLQLVLSQAKERARICKKGSIHALRHSFATHLLDKGTDVSMIMKLLGHNDVRTTMRYLHVSNRDLLQIISPLDTLAL